ncbi:MAG: hypothetical protein QM760_22880 [Nibricoccus sp.]
MHLLTPVWKRLRPLRRTLITAALLCFTLPLCEGQQLGVENPVPPEGGVSGGGTRPTPRDPSDIDAASDAVPLDMNSGLLSGTEDSASKLSQLLPIYFPAPAPLLDSDLPPPPAVRDPVWAELAPYINEPFLAPLSTRISQGPLNRRLRQRLDAYRAAGAVLLLDIRNHVSSNSDAAALSSLARQQESPLQELNNSADQLRRELRITRFLNRSADWNAYRNWYLGDPPGRRTAQDILNDQFSVFRAATYYQEGLSSNQRQLLREISSELTETLGNRSSRPPIDSFEPANIIYFHPFGSRIRLPDLLPAALQQEVDKFLQTKASLKSELQEALVRLDRESDAKKERALQELARKQEPRFHELTVLAEKIRLQLAALPVSSQPAVQLGLPAPLVTRIGAYLREKNALQQAAQKTSRDPAASQRSSTGKLTLADFENQNRERLAALSLEAARIREEVAAATTGRPGEPSKSVDALLAEFMRAFKYQQLENQYRDYRTAVLLPGLSPSQRQLLFNAALSSLDLVGDKDWQAVPE